MPETLTPAAPVCWSALDLGNCRTGFLQSIDRTRIPAPAARAITAELAARQQET